MNIYAQAIQIYEDSQDHAKLLLEVLKGSPGAIIKAHNRLKTIKAGLNIAEIEARSIARSGEKIKAIKFLRSSVSPTMGLKEAKERVEELMEMP